MPKSYALWAWLRGEGTFIAYYTENPGYGPEVPEAAHDAAGGFRVTEYEGEPTHKGFSDADPHTMVTKYYRE